MRTIILYRDDSTTQVVYENVKHFFWTCGNTVAARALLLVQRRSASSGQVRSYRRNEMMAGNLIVFRGDDEVKDEAVLVDFADLKKDGMVEISFQQGREHVWVSFKLHDLVEKIAFQNGSE